ncbi:hypothetical protein GCM10010392_14640 [Streptomyces clavifer]|nr:hypothetical protein GCM10010392_14640 [Streptomyces clavifer]
MHATSDEVLDEPREGCRVDLPIAVERGADRRYDAVQRCGQRHGEGSSSVESGPGPRGRDRDMRRKMSYV